MRFALVLVMVLLAGERRAAACPLGSTGCFRFEKADWVHSEVYIRSSYAKPPKFDDEADRAQVIKFLTGAAWKPVKSDLHRWQQDLKDDKTKVVGMSLRFVDPTRIKTKPRPAKGEKLVLVREVEPGGRRSLVKVSVDGTAYAIVVCKRGDKVSTCLVAQSEIDATDKIFTDKAKISDRL